jgi:hypothetical protein
MNMSFSPESCKQKEVKTILLKNEFEMQYLKYNSRYFHEYH